MFLVQWTANGATGVSGRNVVRNAAEEYNDVIAPAITRSSAATVAMVTRRKSKSATWCRVQVVLSIRQFTLWTMKTYQFVYYHNSGAVGAIFTIFVLVATGMNTLLHLLT